MTVRQKFILFGTISFAVPCGVIFLLFVNFTSDVESLQIGNLTFRNKLPQYLVHNYLFFAIGVIIIMMILYGIIGYAILKSLLNPLDKLKNIAEQIGKGNLDTEVVYNKTDEVGEVFIAFDKMRTHLKDSIAKRANIENTRKEMIANIAHDLKTPITTISGYSLGLLEGIADTDEKKEKYLRTILQRSQDINRMADDLSLSAKIDSNKILFDSHCVNLVSCLTEITEQIFPEYKVFGENVNELIININPCEIENPIVKIDTAKYKRIVENIISNSIKYRKENRTQITIDIYENEHSIITKFTDSGRGISEKDIQYIFDRFYRVDSARTNVRGGSGLGLSITKQLVEAQGGSIWARSKENEWTSIYISFTKIANSVEKI